MNINFEDIVKRGYCLDEEYDTLHKGNLNIIRVSSEAKDERFWGYSIPNENNLFILANHPLDFFGSPRGLIAMVAYHNNHVMDNAKSIELFEKAGQEAIDYYHKAK